MKDILYLIGVIFLFISLILFSIYFNYNYKKWIIKESIREILNERK